MPETLEHGGHVFHKVEDPKGKKAKQVAQIISQLQSNPGAPIEFDKLCEDVGAKYPQDIQAAAFALQLTEQVDHYVLSSEVGHRSKAFYVWTGQPGPSSASAG